MLRDSQISVYSVGEYNLFPGLEVFPLSSCVHEGMVLQQITGDPYPVITNSLKITEVVAATHLLYGEELVLGSVP